MHGGLLLCRLLLSVEGWWCAAPVSQSEWLLPTPTAGKDGNKSLGLNIERIQ